LSLFRSLFVTFSVKASFGEIEGLLASSDSYPVEHEALLRTLKPRQFSKEGIITLLMSLTELQLVAVRSPLY